MGDTPATVYTIKVSTAGVPPVEFKAYTFGSSYKGAPPSPPLLFMEGANPISLNGGPAMVARAGKVLGEPLSVNVFLTKEDYDMVKTGNGYKCVGKGIIKTTRVSGAKINLEEIGRAHV